ncbi:MAG: MBL fold metallo-hydrolase [Asgard group archaeon]|nr:MBL fold metallo-hydrolase [Asgard group archaeon]
MQQFSDHLFSLSGKGLFGMPLFVIVKNDKELFLVDTGLKKDAKANITLIEEHWGSLTKVKKIIFTHRHYDHTGGLQPILERLAATKSKVDILCHKDEEQLFIDELQKFAVRPTKTLKHDEMIDRNLKLKAIHTPGHTYGHLSLLFEKDKLILVGDLFMDTFGRLSSVFKKFHDDYSLWQKALPTILNYDWDYAIPTHMKAKKIPRAKVEAFIQKYHISDE